MADQTIKTIIQHRHDTEDNWGISKYKPLAGELIVYDVDDTHPYERFKIGDGITDVYDLPFAAASYAELQELAEGFEGVILEMYGPDIPEGTDTVPTIRGIAEDVVKNTAPKNHNQASNTINAMTGYSKASSASAITTSDSLNTAIGKLEKALDGKGTSNLTIGTTATTAAAGNHNHNSSYLPKLAYEWNKSYNAGGTAGYLLIGSFPMYDSNLTIDIDSTTSTTYHGTVVIATQNVSETSIGSSHTITVYGDPTGTISEALRVVWNSGSRNYNIYFVPATWSKNLIHIRALGNYLENTDETKICSQFTAGTAPTTTNGLTVVNALKGALDGKAASSHTHSYNDLTNKPTIPTVNNATLTLNVGGQTVSGNNAFSANDATNTTYNVPSATASAYGVVKVSSVNSSAVTVNAESTTAGRYYPVELNSDGKAIVNVPWTISDLSGYATKDELDELKDAGIIIVQSGDTLTIGGAS